VGISVAADWGYTENDFVRGITAYNGNDGGVVYHQAVGVVESTPVM